MKTTIVKNGEWDETLDAYGARILYILEKGDLVRFLERLSTSALVAFDTETTGLDPWATSGDGEVAARISLATFTLGQSDGDGNWDGEDPITYVLPLSHPRSPFLGQWRHLLRVVMEHLVKWQKKWVGHHAKFDTRYVYGVTGVYIGDLMHWDTQVSAHLIDETKSTALKVHAPDLLGIEPWDDGIDFSKSGASENQEFWTLARYAALDTYMTFKIFIRHRELLWLEVDRAEDDTESFSSISPQNREEWEDARIGKIAEYLSMPVARSLGRLETEGIRVDAEWVFARLEELSRIEDETTRELKEWDRAYDFDRDFIPREEPNSKPLQKLNLNVYAPFRTGAKSSAETIIEIPSEPATEVIAEVVIPDNFSTASGSKWFKSFTEKAVENGDLELSSMTAKGNPQWTKDTLAKQARGGSKIAETIFTHRKVQKQQQFLTSWIEKTSPHGRIHSTYRQATTRSGRLSSSEPNLQQVEKALRPAFIPRPGHLIAELDYSQLELRVIAFISRSMPMIEAFQNNEDLHSMVAAQILTQKARHGGDSEAIILPSEVSKADRQLGKAANFGLAYKQSVMGFVNYAAVAFGVDLTEEEALEAYNAYFSTWSGIREWQDSAIRFAKNNGYILSPLGRRRLLPDMHSYSDHKRGQAERQAVNSPVQGFGSDLMMMAMASIYGEIGRDSPVSGAIPVATVHDSLVLEVPEKNWEEVVNECRLRMENPHHHLRHLEVNLDVPLVADFTVGTRWGLSDVYSPD